MSDPSREEIQKAANSHTINTWVGEVTVTTQPTTDATAVIGRDLALSAPQGTIPNMAHGVISTIDIQSRQPIPMNWLGRNGPSKTVVG